MRASIFTLLLLLFSLPAFGQELHWHTDFAEAKTAALEENRSVLLVFSGSDWCKPCIRLKAEILETPNFRKFARENLTLLRLDFPRKRKNRLEEAQLRHNEDLAERFNRKGEFPLVLLLDENEQVRWRRAGHDLSLSEFIQQIQSHLPIE